MKNIFDAADLQTMLDRINALTPDTERKWGKMKVDQMLAHCNVSFDMSFTNMYPKPTGLKKMMIKFFAKQAVVGPKPYPANGRTSREFIISDRRDFEMEKKKLTDYMQKTHDLGSDHFEGKESHAFGKLTAEEWNVMFTKHLDHHLTQFGV